jgi:hypothetical protein
MFVYCLEGNYRANLNISRKIRETQFTQYGERYKCNSLTVRGGNEKLLRRKYLIWGSASCCRLPGDARNGRGTVPVGPAATSRNTATNPTDTAFHRTPLSIYIIRNDTLTSLDCMTRKTFVLCSELLSHSLHSVAASEHTVLMTLAWKNLPSNYARGGGGGGETWLLCGTDWGFTYNSGYILSSDGHITEDETAVFTYWFVLCNGIIRLFYRNYTSFLQKLYVFFTEIVRICYRNCTSSLQKLYVYFTEIVRLFCRNYTYFLQKLYVFLQKLYVFFTEIVRIF